MDSLYLIRQKRISCPGCGHIVGLYDREGNHVADEWHQDHVEFITSSITLFADDGAVAKFTGRSQIICNQGK